MIEIKNIQLNKNKDSCFFEYNNDYYKYSLYGGFNTHGKQSIIEDIINSIEYFADSNLYELKPKLFDSEYLGYIRNSKLNYLIND